jgi:hypothetical protein
VTIERRGRSHRAVCTCGWRSHAWNELRPAEADAWHHVYGDEVIVDISAIPDERSPGTPRAARHSGAGTPPGVTELVRQAQDLASRPSPYSRNAAPELWRTAEESAVTIHAAIGEIEELLSRHDRQSSGAADSEWLMLITAKRLLTEALAYGETRRPARRALI